MAGDPADEDSRPPSPILRPGAPGSLSNTNLGMGFFSVPFERFVRDDVSDWTSAFTLLGECYVYLLLY